MSDSLEQLHLELLSLSVYRKVLRQPVTAALAEAVAAAGQGDIPRLCGAAGNLCAMLAEKGKLDSLPAAVAEEVLGDDNAYSAALTRRTIPHRLWWSGRRCGILAACTARPP